jgi:hypothetical protein
MRRWIKDEGWSIPPEVQRVIVVWFHDESTFFANDRRQTYWMPPDKGPSPYAKGQGVSLMVAHFVSADYGWLESPDGKETAMVIFRAGRGRDGYFTCDDIIAQFRKAVEMVIKYYPGEDHVFIFDNASTHMKRDDDALSASKMTKGPSENFFVETNVIDGEGRQVYDVHGKLKKQKVRMGNAKLANGEDQPLYFPADHPTHPNHFKGMVQILMERGYNVCGKKAQCKKKFKDCLDDGTRNDCCCRQMLYKEPDFVNVESRLEKVARSYGIKVHFLPKFHCELNFIEQCWGCAKRHYRLYPPPPKKEIEADLEKKMLESLRQVTLEAMRR